MLKKSLAWVLTLAMLISALSGMALITSATTDAKFAYLSFESGVPMTKNAEFTAKSAYETNGTTEMADITGKPGDRSACFMAEQNNILGITIPAGSGISSNATIEVEFFASEYNMGDTRMGLNYTNDSGKENDFGSIKMSGTNTLEQVVIDTSKNEGLDDVTAEIIGAGSEGEWMTLKVDVVNADFSAGGKVNIVKWSYDNSTRPEDCDGWYVKSILVYDTTAGKPDEEDLYIREDTTGYIDFAADDAERLEYKADGATKTDAGLKLAGKALTVTATEDKHPAALATDKRITLLAQYRVGDGDWKIARKDITDNAGITFDFSELFEGEGDVTVEKVVVARTNLVIENTFENQAFVNFNEPYQSYNELSKEFVTYKADYSFEGEGTVAKVETENGNKTAATVDGYLNINVDDAFTVNGSAKLHDVKITVTYLDKGEGDLNLHYNKIPADAEDIKDADNFAGVKVATLTNSGEWKTATVYLSDADFRNAANGNDFRVDLFGKKNVAIAAVSVSIGADKADLIKAIDVIVNLNKYTDDTATAYSAAKAAAETVRDNIFATAASVATALKNLKDAFDALEIDPTKGDPRYTTLNALYDLNKWDGEITTLDGDYCWHFPENVDSKFISLGDAEGILDDSKSVTYEYEILWKTADANDRVFLGFGSKEFGYTSVNDHKDEGNFNGYAVHGNWLSPVPAANEWGTITMVNDDFDPKANYNNEAGMITSLGNWVAHGDLYVRSIKVYDTENPENMVLFQFNEVAVDLVPSDATDEGVVKGEYANFESYVIPSGWRRLKFLTKNLIDDGVIAAGENNIRIDFEYYLDENVNGDPNNELFQIVHYNPDGNGNNDKKTAECEHHIRIADSDFVRGEWAKMSMTLNDFNFGAAGGEFPNGEFGLKYGNGDALHIRGVRICALDDEGNVKEGSVARWGTMLIKAEPIDTDHPFYDWTLGAGYGLKVKFDEFSEGYSEENIEKYEGVVIGENEPTDIKVAFADALLFVDVQDDLVAGQYVRIDITHMDGYAMYLRYNKILPEGIDDSEEPYLTQYRFHASGENEEIVELEDGTKKNEFVDGEDAFKNMLGVIKPTPAGLDDDVFMTTSIYLTDAQFRNMANGFDFRIHGLSGIAISRIDVYFITEDEIPTLGDTTNLKKAYEDADAKFGSNAPAELATVLDEVAEFLEYNYRATKEEVDAMLKKLEDAIKNAPAGVAGDADNSGDVTTSDARAILQVLAELKPESEINMALADVDGIEGVTTNDARVILQYLAELIPALPLSK